MKKLLVIAAFIGFILGCGVQTIAKMVSMAHFSDGVKIGPDVGGSDRLGIIDFDEYAAGSDLQELTAGETKTLVFEGFDNLRAGTTLVVAPSTPNMFNQDKLLILHAWVSDEGEVSVTVKNLANSTVDFDSDQWVIGGWNTVNTSQKRKIATRKY